MQLVDEILLCIQQYIKMTCSESKGNKTESTRSSFCSVYLRMESVHIFHVCILTSKTRTLTLRNLHLKSTVINVLAKTSFVKTNLLQKKMFNI